MNLNNVKNVENATTALTVLNRFVKVGVNKFDPKTKQNVIDIVNSGIKIKLKTDNLSEGFQDVKFKFDELEKAYLENIATTLNKVDKKSNITISEIIYKRTDYKKLNASIQGVCKNILNG